MMVFWKTPCFLRCLCPGQHEDLQPWLRVGMGFLLAKIQLGGVHCCCFTACNILEPHHFLKPNWNYKDNFHGFCFSSMNHEACWRVKMKAFNHSKSLSHTQFQDIFFRGRFSGTVMPVMHYTNTIFKKSDRWKKSTSHGSFLMPGMMPSFIHFSGPQFVQQHHHLSLTAKLFGLFGHNAPDIQKKS